MRDPGQELQRVILDVLGRVLRRLDCQILVSCAEYLESPHPDVLDLTASLRVSPKLNYFLSESPSVKVHAACPLTTVSDAIKMKVLVIYQSHC